LKQKAATGEDSLPYKFCAGAAEDRPRAAGGPAERGELKPGVSATTVPRLAELGTAASGVCEKAARSSTESGVTVTTPPGAEGSSSSSTTRTGSSGAEEGHRFGGDGVSSRRMGSPAASSCRFWTGGDGEKASRKPDWEVEAAEPWERLREEGGEANAAGKARGSSSSSSSRMSTKGIWRDAMGGSVWGFAGRRRRTGILILDFERFGGIGHPATAPFAAALVAVSAQPNQPF